MKQSSGLACLAQHPVCLLEERSPRLPRLCPLLPPEVTLSLWLPALLGAHSLGERRAGECPWTALAQGGDYFSKLQLSPGRGFVPWAFQTVGRGGESHAACEPWEPGAFRVLGVVETCALPHLGGSPLSVLCSHGCSHLTRLWAPRSRKLDPTPLSRDRSSTLLLPSC